jgi:hypothetical protein
MYAWSLLGLDTLERIGIDYGRGDAYDALPFELRPGPKITPYYLGRPPGKLLFLYPEHLKLVYDRLRAANPKGVVLVAGEGFEKYAPPGLTKKELDKLEEERKIFVDPFMTDATLGYPHARKYLPELFEPGMIDRMAADPWLDILLLGKAIKEGAVPDGPSESSRWSPEWRAYCDRLIASGNSK